MDSVESVVSNLIRRDRYWPLPVLVYLAVIPSSLVAGLTLTPGLVANTSGRVLSLAVLVVIAYSIKYLLRAAVFYAIARMRDQSSDFARIVAGIIICSVPELAVLWLSILVPGFIAVDELGLTTYPVTSVAFYLRGFNLNPVMLHLLGVIELFNVISLVLLALLLRVISRLPLALGFLVNLILDLGIQLIPR